MRNPDSVREVDPARCPYPACGCVYDSEPRARQATCPACGRTVRVRFLRHEAAMSRRAAQASAQVLPEPLAGLCVLAEDVRSLWNVGALFRSADGLGVRHLFLCGISGIPPHPEIHRTALGAEDAISWTYHRHAFEALEHWKRRAQTRAVALESTERATLLTQSPRSTSLLLVVGNEVDGVSPEVLDAVDEHVHIPMRGVKHSLNVAVAAGIAMYHYQDGRPSS